ncbi:MAG TPA: hypothetical protein VNZ64_25815 [Candidatus Acidoferrum sp.]|jgi:hypothetical protein|nr:hypothetical protein [Candidatus Acidoferrum sp.]
MESSDHSKSGVVSTRSPKGALDELASRGKRNSRLLSVVALGGVFLLLIAVGLPRPNATSNAPFPAARPGALDSGRFEYRPHFTPAARSAKATGDFEASKTAEQIVGAKLAKFARSRRQLAYALAARHGVEVPDAVNRFFDAVEGGNWDEIDARYKEIDGGDASASHGAGRPPGVNDLWSAIVDAYGAAEQVHLWPAQKLLDYGNAILGSLKPGMVYVGGTDNGRWIPELLNDTADGAQHIVVTQNALADGKYLEYVTELYGDRLTALSQEDSQTAFQEYMKDAEKRLQHDQQFPDEPKQVLPGENISIADGRTTVSGQVAVMQINERLLRMLMDKNPDMSFALQESFPLKGTYADAVPLGPLMELRAQDAQNGFTGERATQALDYWSTTVENVLADPEATGSENALRAYSHDVNATAHLLASHNYTAQAEQAYQLASQLCPFNPEPINGLADILASSGRTDEARQLLDNFSRAYPDQRAALAATWSAAITFKRTEPAP